MSENSTGVTVTLKAGTGFEAPWIVIHAADTKDALAQIDTGDFGSLAERTVAAAEFFRAAHNVKTGLPPTPPPAPAQSDGPSWSQPNPTDPPPAPPQGKMCSHGAMVYREGSSARGPWKGYFCPLPQARKVEQCKPEFLR